MANNEPSKWLKEFLIPNAYSPVKAEIEGLQSQNGRTELIEKYNVAGEIDNGSPEVVKDIYN